MACLQLGRPLNLVPGALILPAHGASEERPWLGLACYCNN